MIILMSKKEVSLELSLVLEEQVKILVSIVTTMVIIGIVQEGLRERGGIC